MWHRLRPWIFPVDCLGCHVPGSALCARCAPGPHERLAELISGVPVTAAASYDGILRRAIVAMKSGERAYLDPFAALLAELLPAGVSLVPLPTSRGRRAARGFDQSIELARRAAAIRDAACCEILVKRGAAQRGLDRTRRLAAAARFAIKPGAVLPEFAIVIDDVCTTGATLIDGVATLRRAGVAVVGAVVLARTASGRNSRHPAAVFADGPYRHPKEQPP